MEEQIKAVTVNFFSGRKEYRSLSNFWECEVVIDGIRVYDTGEHCFHGEKYTRLGELENRSETRRQQLLDYGRRFQRPSVYLTGAEAKRGGGKKGMILNEAEMATWNDIRVDVQRQICLWKKEHEEVVKNDLLKSGDKILVHPAMRCSEEKVERQSFWEGRAVMRDGKVIILGRNQLGNCWMEMREGTKNE